MHPKILWPNNKRFAFTIFDDTDRANLKDNQLVYRCLDELNFKTTKSTWVSKSNKSHEDSGITCEDKIYLKWLLELKNKGFEGEDIGKELRKERIKNLEKMLL